MKDSRTVITIGRQFGSGGKLIGQELAEKLGYAFYDKNLIALAAKESGLSEEIFERTDEITTGFWNGSFLDIPSVGNFHRTVLSSENLFNIQAEVIRGLSEKQDCIFVGRCSDYVLRKHPCCFNIFIHADIQDRVNRIAQLHHKTAEEALKWIQKTDKERANYYNHYTDKTWGMCSSYHLSVDSSILGVSHTAEFIYQWIVSALEKQA